MEWTFVSLTNQLPDFSLTSMTSESDTKLKLENILKFKHYSLAKNIIASLYTQ